ncbi:TetR/AcrR family transcriptional regulator [Paenibacillus sp. GCM10012307]|uniref:TetR/AcrR family transcriptional regulator n=1 Tax=Paenibacillus roseus TaxID=2798579 RepID=A0A934J3H6_9BACL|nr:TetR/AcrR family transcriptional regulator [Paenibacillus roseus]MBJ6364081.1 TetR/AcrR family transcriptional regulator [Paenibacillus roseus]
MKGATGDTKRKIVEAAYRVLAEQGFEKTSTKEIAKQAGISQGLINYYFVSKEDLMFEIFHLESVRYMEEMHKISEITLDKNFIRHALAVPQNMVHEYPDWHRLRFELFAIGLRSEAGRKKIRQSLEAGKGEVLKTLSLLPLKEGVNQKALASIINITIDGLALEKMADPDFDMDAAYLTLSELLEAYLDFENS